MPDQAKVTSLEALEAFRSALIIYLEKAGRVLDEVHDEVIRTRVWLEMEQRQFWEAEIRRRARQLEDREQELFTARFSSLTTVSPLHQAAVREAKSALSAAEAKLDSVKRWRRSYDHQVVPLSKDVDKLRSLLAHEMRGGVRFLTEVIKTLDAYSRVGAPGLAGSGAPAGGETPAREKGETGAPEETR